MVYNIIKQILSTSWKSYLQQFTLTFHRPLLIFISIFFVFTVLSEIDVSLPSPSEYNAFAHMPISNTSSIQEWTDHYSGISILFNYEPEKPIIDTFTKLSFSIQNITTGNHISDADNAKARVVVTNGQRLFKFENITVGDNGHFFCEIPISRGWNPPSHNKTRYQ